MRSALVVLALVALPAFATGVTEVPAPSPGNWVIDLTGRIPQADLSAANGMAETAYKRGLGTIGVVIVPTTSRTSSRAFAEALHDRWNFGSARGDGILFFIALDDHKAETLLPSGLRSSVDQRRSDEAMSDVIVPAFKRGDPGGAVRDGTRALLTLLEKSPLNANAEADPSAMQPLRPDEVPIVPSGPANVKDLTDIQRRSRTFVTDDAKLLYANNRQAMESTLNGLYADGRGRLYLFVVRGASYSMSPTEMAKRLYSDLGTLGNDIQVAVLSTWPSGLAVVGDSTKSNVHGWALDELSSEVLEKLGHDDVNGAATEFVDGYDRLARGGPSMADYQTVASRRIGDLFRENALPLSALFLCAIVAGLFGLARWLRYRPRKCQICGGQRVLLDEQADDAHLSAGERAEEQLKSVDYDVWWCGHCHDALVLRHKAFFTRYRQCPQCNFIVAMQKTRTIVYATEWSGGQVEVSLDCTRCGHHSSYIRYTPRITRSYSSSSSSSGSSFSSGGGGGSFGGSSGSW